MSYSFREVRAVLLILIYYDNRYAEGSFGSAKSPYKNYYDTQIDHKFSLMALTHLVELGFISERMYEYYNDDDEPQSRTDYDVTPQGALAVERWYSISNHYFPAAERDDGEYDIRSGPGISEIIGDSFDLDEFDRLAGLPP